MRCVFAITALLLVLALSGVPALGSELGIQLGGQVEYDNNIDNYHPINFIHFQHNINFHINYFF